MPISQCSKASAQIAQQCNTHHESCSHDYVGWEMTLQYLLHNFSSVKCFSLEDWMFRV